MIGKQIKGRDFSGCLAYVLGKPGAKLIGGNMEGTTPQELTIEFEQIRQRNERVQRPVYHCALSLSPGESFTDEAWRDVAGKYLKAMGFSRNQYVLVRHTDTENHEHIHIVANRVQRNGEVVTDSWDFRRSETILRQLEQEYALTPIPPSWESDRASPTRRELEKERKTTKPSVRQRLQNLIDGLFDSDRTITSFDQLMARLAEGGVLVRVRRDQHAQIQGISFELEGVAIAGSKLGRAYSLPQIEQRLLGTASSERLSPSDAVRVRKLLNQQVQQVQSLPELVEQLNQSGVEATLRLFPQGQRLIVEVDGKLVSSSRLGNLYSVKGLSARLTRSRSPKSSVQSQLTQEGLHQPSVSTEALRTILIHQQLRQKIDSAQQVSHSLPELIEQLAQVGVQAKIRYTRQQQPQGISFSLDEVTIAGSRLGSSYSLQQLTLRLERAQPTAPILSMNGDELESIYERLYHHVLQQVQKQSKRPRSQDGIDLAIAQYILLNGKETDIKALVHSPQIEEIRRTSGRKEAEIHLQQLLQKAAEFLEPRQSVRSARTQKLMSQFSSRDQER
ncbi:MAG: relaxase/mobilization nuclease domain-containing protein [Plectolyngbya sp. WJT66-NPBG17]|jgi:hypothetical protein|nr:relaxase/mobilization nuclease domain-containing protein [Plectolyngbya sp. WJT66-NPBG17]